MTEKWKYDVHSPLEDDPCEEVIIIKEIKTSKRLGSAMRNNSACQLIDLTVEICCRIDLVGIRECDRV